MGVTRQRSEPSRCRRIKGGAPSWRDGLRCSSPTVKTFAERAEEAAFGRENGSRPPVWAARSAPRCSATTTPHNRTTRSERTVRPSNSRQQCDAIVPLARTICQDDFVVSVICTPGTGRAMMSGRCGTGLADELRGLVAALTGRGQDQLVRTQVPGCRNGLVSGSSRIASAFWKSP